MVPKLLRFAGILVLMVPKTTVYSRVPNLFFAGMLVLKETDLLCSFQGFGPHRTKAAVFPEIFVQRKKKS